MASFDRKGHVEKASWERPSRGKIVPDLSETCRGSRFFVQSVCKSLSITLSPTTSQSMLSGESDITSGLHMPVHSFKGEGKRWILRRGLTAMRSLNRPPGYKGLITSREDARRRTRVANKTLKKCKKQAHGLKSLWGVRTKISLGHETDWSRMKLHNLSLFRSHSSNLIVWNDVWFPSNLAPRRFYLQVVYHSLSIKHKHTHKHNIVHSYSGQSTQAKGTTSSINISTRDME